MSDKCPKCVELEAEIERLRLALSRQQDEIQQELGKALGYPPFDESVMKKPDGSVCVGDHVAESLASEAAKEIERLRAVNAKLLAACKAAVVVYTQGTDRLCREAIAEAEKGA